MIINHWHLIDIKCDANLDNCNLSARIDGKNLPNCRKMGKKIGWFFIILENKSICPECYKFILANLPKICNKCR